MPLILYEITPSKIPKQPLGFSPAALKIGVYKAGIAML